MATVLNRLVRPDPTLVSCIRRRPRPRRNQLRSCQGRAESDAGGEHKVPLHAAALSEKRTASLAVTTSQATYRWPITLAAGDLHDGDSAADGARC
jgi:hypothetical protein